VHADVESLDEAYGEIHRDHPFQSPPDFVAAVRRLIERPDFQFLLRRT
jgi:hypothetical protein